MLIALPILNLASWFSPQRQIIFAFTVPVFREHSPIHSSYAG